MINYKEKLYNTWKKVSTIKDTRHAIALGIAIGLAWNFIPSLGVGFFIPILYSLNMVTGRFVIGDFLPIIEIEGQLAQSIQSSLDSIQTVKKYPFKFFLFRQCRRGWVGVFPWWFLFWWFY